MTYVEQKMYYQFDFQILSQSSLRVMLQDLIDERYRLMMDSFETILRDIPSANSVVDSHMLIAEISGIALNYLFAKDDYPLAEIKERFIKISVAIQFVDKEFISMKTPHQIQYEAFAAAGGLYDERHAKLYADFADALIESGSFSIIYKG